MCFAPRVWDEVGMEMEWGWGETRDGVAMGWRWKYLKLRFYSRLPTF